MLRGRTLVSIFLFVFITFPLFSQNFDYQLQNTLERLYSNPETKNKEDFNLFQKTFFSEGYTSFEYLSSILNKNEYIKKNHILFLYRVDPSKKTFRKIEKDIIKRNGVYNAFLFAIDSFLNYLSNIEHFSKFTVHCLSNLYLALFLFISIFGVVSLLSFFRLINYDIKRLLIKQNLNTRLAHYLAFFVVIFFPVFLTIHIRYLPIYWLILSFIYLGKKQKMAVYLGLVFLTIVSFIGGGLNEFSVDFFKNKAFYYESFVSPFSAVSEKDGKLNDFQNLAIGVSYLRGGRPVDGVKFLKLVSKTSVFYPYSLNNIGVAYILLSRPKLALDYFKKAEKNGLGFQSNINRFYLNNKMYNIVESEEAIKNAFKAGNTKTVEWLRLNIKEPYPLIAVPSFYDFMRYFFNSFSIEKRGFPFKLPFFFLFITLILGIIHFLTKDLSLTRSCIRCGTPFRVFESQNEKLCTQCAIMQKSKGEMSSDMIEAKKREIKLYSMIKESFEIGLGIVFPGFYNIFVLNRPVSGIIIFLLTLILILDALFAFRITESLILITPLFIMLGFLILINLINVFFEKGEE